jgi:hypothetical protein
MKHLHSLYLDPMTARPADWVMVHQGESGVLGVHSRSTLSAFKKLEFPVQYRDSSTRRLMQGGCLWLR